MKRFQYYSVESLYVGEINRSIRGGWVLTIRPLLINSSAGGREANGVKINDFQKRTKFLSQINILIRLGQSGVNVC